MVCSNWILFLYDEGTERRCNKYINLLDRDCENEDGPNKNEELPWRAEEGQGSELIWNWGLGGGVESMLAS